MTRYLCTSGSSRRGTSVRISIANQYVVTYSDNNK